jgi:RNA polymerase sigma factor (TIGR02999 family)
MEQSSENSSEVTLLLHQWRDGDANAESRLFQLVEPNLRKLARYLVSREWKEHSIQATELINEAYLELLDAKDRDWQNRRHFFALTATIMRRYLIDMARRARPRLAAVDPNDAAMGIEESPERAAALNQLLGQMAHKHQDWCTVFEMRHFLGFTDAEVAQELRLSVRTVQRIWHDARAWLLERWDAPPRVGSGL